MESTSPPSHRAASPDTYWLTRFVLLRWMGFIYVIAFYVAAKQLVPLVGANGLTPATLYFQSSDALTGFLTLPSIFWIDCSDTWLRAVPWIGVVISCVVLAGYANALMMTV